MTTLNHEFGTREWIDSVRVPTTAWCLQYEIRRVWKTNIDLEIFCGMMVMSIELVIGVISHQYHPSIFFCVGLVTSILCCMLALVVESRIRQRQFHSADLTARRQNYQRFRNELLATSRHVGFTTDEVSDLEDHEFH